MFEKKIMKISTWKLLNITWTFYIFETNDQSNPLAEPNSTQPKIFSLISSALCRDWCVGSEAEPLSFNCTRAKANFRVRGTSFDRSMMWIKSPAVSTWKEMRSDVKWPAINFNSFPRLVLRAASVGRYLQIATKMGSTHHNARCHLS